MIGLDTNILVRYLTQDDAAQAALAAEVVERRITQGEPGFVSLVTVAELVWVLDSFYEFTGKEIAAAVERLLQIDTLNIQNEREVFAAMVALRTGLGSFDDALIGALGAWAGCSEMLTLDRKAARLRGFSLA
ncbi:MAG: type II toxin-antitoxin system VapC family toxin [Acidobacteriaceae bacterium]